MHCRISPGFGTYDDHMSYWQDLCYWQNDRLQKGSAPYRVCNGDALVFDEKQIPHWNGVE